jgi:hypothetical protein
VQISFHLIVLPTDRSAPGLHIVHNVLYLVIDLLLIDRSAPDRTDAHKRVSIQRGHIPGLGS